MNKGKVDWRGCFTAAITPFKANGEVDEAKYVENLELLISEGVRGLVISGCTGESWALEPEERLHLFKLAVQVSRKRVTVIGGTGGIMTKKVVELSKAAKDVGVDGVMVLPPYYAVPGMREIFHHYNAISDGAQVPILLYNIPRRTAVDMRPEFYEKLAELEWVCGVKESSNDFIQLEQVLAGVADRLDILAGHSAERGVAAVLMGCKGWVSSMESQVMGREAISMYDLVMAGKVEQAKAIQFRSLKLDKALRMGVGTFPANTKAAMNLLGRPGGHVRPPLLDLTPEELARTGEVLRAVGLLGAERAAAE